MPKSVSIVLAVAGCAIAGAAVGQNGPTTSQGGKTQWQKASPGERSSTFTFVGLPDTQRYSESFPSIFAAQTQWVVDNRLRHNIQFVSHYGDLVQHGHTDSRAAQEWINASSAMQTLLDSDIAMSVVAGNHDVLPTGSVGEAYDTSNYLHYFGPQHFQNRREFGGASASGLSTYQVFNGGGKTFLHLGLHVDTPAEELEWAQGVLAGNRDKAVIVTTHRYLQDADDYIPDGLEPITGLAVESGRYPDIWYGIEDNYSPNGVNSEDLFQHFIALNPNIAMVNSGHFHEEYRQTSTNAFGKRVHEVLADYQDDPNGGNGYLRMMEFDLDDNKIRVDSYSPTLDNHLTKDESKFELDFDYNDYTRTNSATFINGVNGYTGTQDTWISEEDKGRSYGNDATISIDDDVNNSIFSDREGQGLIRFNNIFSPDGNDGTIPLGATITTAQLRLTVTDDVDFVFDPEIRLFFMTRDWNEGSTWDSLGDGLSGSDFDQLIATFDSDNDPDGIKIRIADITAAVQRWADGEANFGLAILEELIGGNDDGIGIASSEAAWSIFRPSLYVEWEDTALASIPTPGTLVLIASAGLGITRRRR